MQRHRISFAAVLVGALLLLGISSGLYASVAVSISVFHEQLAPYGRWVMAGSYGNVWVPRVAAGWAPYVDGEWVYTGYGWTWDSDDPWGGVPCHYGSWAWVDPYGWVWTPGAVWAPAWVTWAYTGDYVGWAPIPPSFALSVTGYVGTPVVLATTRYCFVPARQFVGVRVNSVRVPVERNAAIFSSAVKTTNFRVSGGVVRTVGPPAAQIEKVTARKIAPVSIDRVKTRPTTLDQAGARSGSRVAVAAPAAERERIAAANAEAVTKQAAKKGSAPKAEKTRAEAPTTASKAPPPKPAAHAEEKTTSAEHHEAKPAPKPQTKPAPEKPSAQVAKKTAPKTAPKEPSRTEVAKKTAPKPEAKPAPKKAPPAEPPAGKPSEETRVASHDTRHAPARPAKPAPKPKPQPEHPQPPKDEKPGE